MSRNEERIGMQKVSDVSDTPPADGAKTGTVGFDFATPTEIVDLPSKGTFYPEGHPLHNKETVEIRFMTAKDEDILTSRSLLKKGVAIDRLLQNVLVDKNIKVDELLIGDKNALVVAARITGYGEQYETKITCPNCGSMVEKVFDLREAKVNTPEITLSEKQTFFIDLPKSKVSVECRFLIGKDEKYIAQNIEMKKKNKLPESPITDQMRCFIVSINGDENKGVINNFVNNMPTIDSRHLRSEYQRLMPNIDLTYDFECPECEASQEVQMPFTADFFWTNK